MLRPVQGSGEHYGGNVNRLSERVQILGVHFDDLDPDGIVNSVISECSDGRGGWIVTPNVDIMRQVAADAELAGLVARATLVIVDGAPVQWAGRIAGHKGIQRVPGASLAFPLARAARDRGVPVLLLGGRPGAAEQAAARLTEALPGLDVRDHCPDHGFEDDPERWDEVRAAVRDCAGGIVLCGFGCPKQERVMERLFAEFPDTWFLGIGGTIDFLAGHVSRAPEWVQRAGFEWVYRLAVEPKRLARRYLVDGLPFAWHLMVWAAKERQATAPRQAPRALPAGPAAPPEASPVRRIDLDRRTVTLAPTAPGEIPVEVGFGEYLGERLAEARHGEQVDADASPGLRVIDLRDPVDAPRRAIDEHDVRRASPTAQRYH